MLQCSSLASLFGPDGSTEELLQLLSYLLLTCHTSCLSYGCTASVHNEPRSDKTRCACEHAAAVCHMLAEVNPLTNENAALLNHRANHVRDRLSEDTQRGGGYCPVYPELWTRTRKKRRRRKRPQSSTPPLSQFYWLITANQVASVSVDTQRLLFLFLVLHLPSVNAAPPLLQFMMQDVKSN